MLQGHLAYDGRKTGVEEMAVIGDADKMTPDTCPCWDRKQQ